MSFKFTGTKSDYRTDRYNLILATEESGNPNLRPYNGKGSVTIGMGFNLSDDNVRQKVLEAMQITDPDLLEQLNVYLERNYDGVSTERIQTDLDDIMKKFIPDATFGFTSPFSIRQRLPADRYVYVHKNLPVRWLR